ncbi:MAG TPA: ParA family protein, partial [Phycisphaerae bacterium]|nr:ParA family protein [Phycisphaerae bacterium]
MPTILSVANQKGGVGKTTTATSLAHAFGLSGRRVLVVDIDPQANATSGMGVAPTEQSAAFTPGAAEGVVIRTAWEGVWCLPAGRDLERQAAQAGRSADRLEANLSAVGGDGFDVVLIDCPPSLGPLTRSALAASDAA